MGKADLYKLYYNICLLLLSSKLLFSFVNDFTIYLNNICRPQIKVFIEGLFSFDQDIPAFKEHLRDFLVQIRVS
jgi:hypothetical protein